MGGIAARLDDLGKPAWIVLTVLGFIFYWPVGLAVLAFLIWSGRMGCWKHEYAGRWQPSGTSRGADWCSQWFGHRRQGSSGNRAFDEYRTETLRRLEEEQKEFKEFLTRLRFAKDKAEFDEFLADRRRRSQGPDAPSQA
ncbi:MAG TPA: DUF2852 domain-containing protein [Stellaceae bacterium]|nr:DUF2852 domain-containing protein [Stellaceae bacterium]